MRTNKNTVIYLPKGVDANERWETVEGALRAAGITDIRPAPMPAQTFVPRQLRAQVLLSSAEV